MVLIYSQPWVISSKEHISLANSLHHFEYLNT